MKFAFLGYDAMIHCAERLIAEGHELAHVHSFPCDQIFNFHNRAHALAHQHNAEFTITPPTIDNINALIETGVTTFIAAGYPYKIPSIVGQGVYGINIHPSFLPKARGMMPTPYIFLNNPDAAGVTLHKLTDRFDAGDIIMQKRIQLTRQDTVETYTAQAALLASDMVSDVCGNIQHHWAHATPQDESRASTAPMPDDVMRTLNWQDTLAVNDLKSRTFGRFGVLANISGQIVTITAHKAWKGTHTYVPGSIVWDDGNKYVIAVPDGYYMVIQSS